MDSSEEISSPIARSSKEKLSFLAAGVATVAVANERSIPSGVSAAGAAVEVRTGFATFATTV
ncbi:hypothetical protein D3C72_2223660 [compost metagenome]